MKSIASILSRTSSRVVEGINVSSFGFIRAISEREGDAAIISRCYIFSRRDLRASE